MQKSTGTLTLQDKKQTTDLVELTAVQERHQAGAREINESMPNSTSMLLTSQKSSLIVSVFIHFLNKRFFFTPQRVTTGRPSFYYPRMYGNF